MQKILKTVMTLAGGVFLAAQGWADPVSGWKMTAPGTYNLSDAENWVGGDVNGVFGTDLDLEGDQVIVVDQDMTFANGLNVQPGGTGKITFKTVGAKTINANGAGFITSGVCIDVTDSKFTLNGVIKNPAGRMTPAVIAKAGAGQLITNSALNSDHDTLIIRAGTWMFNGAISGADLTISGGADGVANFYGKGNNTLTGRLVLDGATNDLVAQFQKAGSVSTAAQISVRGTSVLLGYAGSNYTCSYFTTNNLVASDSDGYLGLGSNLEPGDIDLRGCPNVVLCSYGDNYSFGGKITVSEGGTLRLGGKKHLHLTSRNMLTGNFNVFVRNNSGTTTYIEALNDLTGRIVVEGSGFCIKDTGSGAGSLPNVDLELRNRSTFFLQATKGSDTPRLKSLTLKASTVSVSASSETDVNATIAGDLIVDGECGGCSFIKFATGTHATKLSAQRLSMPVPGVLAVEGLGLGSTPGANTCNLLFSETPTLLGGGGAAGSPTISILPRVVAGATATGAEEASFDVQTLATYEAGVGVRPLDLESEFATEVPTDDSLVNLRVPFKTTLPLTASARVNSILFQGGAGTDWADDQLTAPEGCNLSVVSGQILCGQRAAGNAVYTRVPIDFGTATGTVLYGSAKSTCFYSSLSGSAGVVLGQVRLDASLNNTHTRFFSQYGNWTLTGNVYVMNNCRIDPNCIPTGNRSGDLYVMGAGVLWHSSMSVNGLYGNGTIRTAKDGVASTLTVGSNGADGDFSGTFGDAANYTLAKNGAGLQRLSGTTQTLKALTVSQGAVQIDGTLTAPVTVADGAGLVVSAPADGVKPEIVGDLTFDGNGSLAYGVSATGVNVPLSVRGDVSVADGKKVTVALSATGVNEPTLLQAQNALSLASFARGANCPRLVLADEGRTLCGAARSGMVIMFY